MHAEPFPLPQLDRTTGDPLAGLEHAVRGDVRRGAHDRMLYATDASLYQVAPLAVVIPESVNDARDAVAWLGAHRLPMLPRGGGTSLAGQCVNHAVVLDLSARCHTLLSVDPAARTATVEPGITIDDLNDRLRAHNLFFAPDPATARHANIGGCIGNNAAGAHSILYGRTSESVLAIDACLWDGTRVCFDGVSARTDPVVRRLAEGIASIVRTHRDQIRARFPKTVRRSAGYQLDVMLQQLEHSGWDASRLNLAPLLCGSEGTLAVTLGATLALHPIPKSKGLGVIAFDSVEAAIDAVAPILALHPSAVELLDDLIIDLARQNTEQRRYVDLLPGGSGGVLVRAVLYAEFFSDLGPDDIDHKLRTLRDTLPDARIATHTDPGAMADAWKLRKAGEPLLHAIPGARKPLGFVEDNAVPPERLGEFVRRFRAIVEREGTIASFYAHASVGVLHVRPLLDLRDPADEARMHRIARDAAALAKELGGVMSGEHGDGRARGPLLEDCFGPELMDAFRAVKHLFDPHGLLNPGNIVDPGPIESISVRTRVRPGADPLPHDGPTTAFRFADQGGMLHAAEMCNGAGVCRKKQGGTMCPSYQATLDERHATRGRGNALRLAMTGQVSPVPSDPKHAAWNDPDTLETLRLCLSCKGCKSECPSNVDIARLKAEYLHQGYRASGRIPLGVRALASVHTLNRIAGLMPGVADSAARCAPVRSVIDGLLGFDPRRSLPRFVSPVRRATHASPGAPTVVLLSDTFTTHNDAPVARAAIRVLGAFGYSVEVVPVSDLGRAAISVGMLDRAVRDARRTFDKVAGWIDDPRVRAFVVCEPSCLSAIADDWLDLRLDLPEGRLRALAERSFLPEDFLERWWDEHPDHPAFTRPPARITVHAHCHQKALWGVGSSSRLLERLAPGRVDTPDTGCCGMAGSFGFDRDRYELSMDIARLSVVPAVERAGPDDWLVMTGTSCRHQTLDATGRHAIHPIEAVDRMMVRSNG